MTLFNLFFRLHQKIRFIIIGGCNSVNGLAIFSLFYYSLQDAFHYLAILFLSGIISIFIAFLMLRFFVFRSKGPFFVEMFRSYLTYLMILCLNAVILFLFVDIMHMQVILSQIITILILAVISYISHKYFSFRQKNE